MSLYNGPPRGGARGGKDQFNWENVKSDKDREFYLGHSVKALAGRWQKGVRVRRAGGGGGQGAGRRRRAPAGADVPVVLYARAGPSNHEPGAALASCAGKDVYWYTREKQAEVTLEDELKAVKQREEEIMMEVSEGQRGCPSGQGRSSWRPLHGHPCCVMRAHSSFWLYGPPRRCHSQKCGRVFAPRTQALGFKPQSAALPKPQLGKQDLEEIIKGE